MSKQKNKRDRITELVILLLFLIISFFLWESYAIYPIKLFVVLLHELSHAVAAILSGGNILNMNIGFDLSGKCEAEGGNTIFIASAGYLGSLLAGILFFLAPNNKSGFWIIIIVSAIILLTTIIVSTGAIFILLALILSALLITAAFYLRIPIVAIVVRAFGLISCVYVLFDIKDDLFFQTEVVSDAAIISGLTDISTSAIGILWALVSIICIYFAIRLSYKN